MDEYEKQSYESSLRIAERILRGEEIPVNKIVATNIILKAEMFRKLCQINKHLDNGIKFDANAPCNVYGEGLVDGIQNAIERGQRGISTHGG